MQTNQLDSYFLKLNPKDIENETLKIKDYARKYYDLGCFYQFNSVFVRYVTSIKSDLSESELQVFLIKYVISSILTSGYDVAISEISKLKLQFHSYDISIYAL